MEVTTVDMRPVEIPGNEAIHELKLLACANTPTGLIVFELQRTEESIRAIAARHGISLKPSNQANATGKTKA